MERQSEKLPSEDQQRNMESYEDYKPVSKSKSQQVKRKIRKRDRKKKGKISNSSDDSSSVLLSLLSKIPFYFDKSKAETIRNFNGKYQSNLHIKNILSNQNTHLYQGGSENLQIKEETYKQLIRSAGNNPVIKKLALKTRDGGAKVCLKFLRDFKNASEQRFLASHRLLNQSQQTLVTKRPQIMSQIVTFARNYEEIHEIPPSQADPILLQTMTLCRLNSQTEFAISKELEKIRERQDPLQYLPLQIDQNPTNILKNQLSICMVIKSFEHSFTQKEIDFLNYHKFLQIQENQEDPDYTNKINSLVDFKKYVQARKPKQNKHPDHLLKTPCSACFSDIIQLSNPILNCPECQMRVHQKCQVMEKRCHRCRYGRTGNAEKKHSAFCYICHRDRQKGLMIMTVTYKAPHMFAHHYCLLLHNLWTMDNQKFSGIYTDLIQQNDACNFCTKNQGMLMKCICCMTPFHGLCAFLNGCSFRMKRGINLEYQAEITCCTDPRLKQKLMFQRKFKLNFEKIIFREEKDLFNYIKDRLFSQEVI